MLRQRRKRGSVKSKDVRHLTPASSAAPKRSLEAALAIAHWTHPDVATPSLLLSPVLADVVIGDWLPIRSAIDGHGTLRQRDGETIASECREFQERRA